MSNSTPQRKGKFVTSLPIWIGVSLVLVVLCFVAWKMEEQKRNSAKVAAKEEAAEAARPMDGKTEIDDFIAKKEANNGPLIMDDATAAALESKAAARDLPAEAKDLFPEGSDPWDTLTQDPGNLRDPSKFKAKPTAPQGWPDSQGGPGKASTRREEEAARRLEQVQQNKDQRLMQALTGQLSVTIKPAAPASSPAAGHGVDDPYSALAFQNSLIDQAKARQGGGPDMNLAGLLSRTNPQLPSPDDQNKQAEKVAWGKEEITRGSLRNDRIGISSPFELRAGTFIPAVLRSQLISDLPGEMVAMVAEDVRDSATGDHVLIPAGSMLVGRYDSAVVWGQERAMTKWDRINFPDGSYFNMGNQNGMDMAGASGFEDQYTSHFWSTMGHAVMLSFVSAGIQYSTQPQQQTGNPNQQQNATTAVSVALGQNLGQVMTEYVRKDMNRQPTITIRPGYRFNVFMAKDAVLDPSKIVRPVPLR